MAEEPALRRIGGPTRSMATIDVGDVVRIETILVDGLRALCNDMGIREGDRVVCRSATSAMLLLEPPDGHIVVLSRNRARFIRVSDPAVRRTA